MTDPSRYRWTPEAPASPGWYWKRLAPGYGGREWEPRIVQVRIDPRSGHLTEVHDSGRWEWAGPIETPGDDA